MAKKTAEEVVSEASAWWQTSLIDIEPGKIAIRGYPIQELIGRVRLPDMIWLMLRGDLPSRGQADLLEAALVPGVDHGPARAVDRHLPDGGDLRLAGQRRHGVGHQCARRHSWRRRPAMHAALSRDRPRRPARTATSSRVATAIIEERRSAGEKIVPGFGHRFHPVDPRTAPLLALVAKAEAAGVVSGRFAAIGRAVESAISSLKGRHIPMNIDGVTAVIFCELGFEPELGRGLFVLSRSVGILAHAWEQKQQGRRIMGPMPKEIPFRYTGPAIRHLGSNDGNKS